ncbi:hypothetical protein DHEL01_v204617 [Diaporthe helianthi]|uniref:Uncharacterized protein n=1 Tax=Diaporthe helianthi TaxID=158607 RepID=A0A2P5I3A8_DIAHE|nr:hypothetical protein DHEL01_v204617 [Diaporthe helianthi]
MPRPEVVELLKARLFVLGLLAGACRYCFGSYTALPGVFLALLITLCTSWEALTIKPPPSPIPEPSPGPGPRQDARDEMAQMAQSLDEMEVLLQSQGDWVDKTGTAFLNSFRHIYKQQRDQLQQYTDFRKEYDEKLSSIQDDHRNEVAEASRTAAENNTALCNLIEQYRQDIEKNQKTVGDHVSSVNAVLLRQGGALTAARERVEASARAAVEENRKLVRELGASVNSVVSDHARLVEDYQAALDGVVLLNTANRVFSLVHVAAGWEVLGFVVEDVQGQGELQPGEQPASMVDNVQELSRTFRGTPNQTAQATPEMTAAMLSQVQDKVQATLKAQQGEETAQLRRAQADIEKLRADLGEIEEFRRLVREREELERQHEDLDKRHRRQREMLEIMRSDPERIQRDEEFCAEVEEITKEVEGKKRVASATATASSSSPGKTCQSRAHLSPLR